MRRRTVREHTSLSSRTKQFGYRHAAMVPSMLAGSFRDNTRGHFTVLFAICCTVLFLGAGLALDYAAMIRTKARLNNALDAATLATSRAISIGEVETSGDGAENYFKAVFAANMGDNEFDHSKYSLDSFTIDTGAQTVAGEVSTIYPLTLLRIGTGTNASQVASYSAATYSGGKVEVAMVFDFSSSMEGAPIDALRSAAKDAVSQLLSANAVEEGNARISLVPYSRAVNVGSYLARYVYPDYNEAESDAPEYDADLHASTGLGYDPDELEHRKCRTKKRSTVCSWPDDYVINDDGSSVDTCSTERKDPNSGTSYRFTDEPPTMGMISRDSRLDDDHCLAAELQPLSSDEDDLLGIISNYQTHSNTAGQIGLQWAWYTISPKWADYLPSGSEPGDPDEDPELRKYIIFMTDGEFNQAYAGNSSSNEWNVSIAEATTGDLCDAVKASGIKIFSIGFDLNDNSAIAMMEDCASPDTDQFTYFYTPDTNSELADVYSEIVASIQTLRLTQ